MATRQRLTLAEVQKGAKVGVLDLETTGLNAGFGWIVAASIVPLIDVSHVFTYRIDQYKGYNKDRSNDKKLVEQFTAKAREFEYLVHFNGLRFDVPFSHSRAMFHRIAWLNSDAKHVDLFHFVKHRMRNSSWALASLLAQLQTAEKKTPLDAPTWAKAAVGHKWALDLIVEHNVQDVLSLAEATRELLRFTELPYRFMR